MNKIVILGHNSSNYEEVEEVLYKKGMARAFKSAVNSLSPQEIVKVLAKSHKITFTDSSKEIKLVKTSEIQPIWSGLFADLMIANIDSKVWGWADPNILPFINYLKEIDHNVLFVLVYRCPKFLFESSSILDEKEFLNTLYDWYFYNKSLLDFYLNNRERAILINSENFKFVNKNLDEGNALIDYNGDINKSLFLIDGDTISIEDSKNFDAINDILLRNIIFKYEDILNLYENLQKQLGLSVSTSTQLDKLKINEFETWKSFEMQNNKLKKKEKEYINLSNKLDLSQKELEIRNNEKKNTENQLGELKKNFWKIDGLSKWQEKRIDELKDEKHKEHELVIKLKKEIEELKKNIKIETSISENKSSSNIGGNMEMLKNLLNLQEELERQYINKNNEDFNLPQIHMLKGAGLRFKQQLPYKLGSMIIHNVKSPKRFLKLPFSIVKLFVEENIRKEIDQSLPDLSEYDDKHEIEKIKNHLSYRLGSKILERRKTFIEWIKLPIELKNQINDFNQESKR